MALPIRRAATLTVAAVIAAGSLAACGANDEDSGNNGGDSGGGAKIALLLPETKTARYEAFDRPIIEKKVKELCSDCKVIYYNANQKNETQQQQVSTAINQGVKVMVLDPVDSKAAESMAADAKDANIPVIAYDRFIKGADYYLSFDNKQVGALQATALVKAMGNKGNIFMLNGAPTDSNAALFKAGAHSVLDKSGVKIIGGKSGEYDNPDWSPDNAQKFMTDKLSSVDPSQIGGVYAANDGQAGGVIAALTGEGGLDPSKLPPVTGQDAELAGIQRIIAGEQYMTIFKSYFIEADKAAEVAVLLAKKKDVTGTTDFQGSAAFIFKPVVVTKDNVKAAIVDTGLYSVDDICTAEYADACASAGLK